MRCKQCDYPLWNLTARVCPECGRPFAPGDFEFVPSSVQFRCPHCAQEYYGTGPNGHLVPPAFDCVRCARHITMDEMTLLPAAGITEQQTARDHMPWLERKDRPIRAWAATIARSLFQPVRLARSIPPESSTLQAWWFAALTHALAIVIGWSPLLLFMLLVLPPGGGAAAGTFASMMLGSIFAAAALVPLWGVLAHTILRLTGKTSQSLGGSVRAVCYASGADAILAVPCLGYYISWIWAGISAALMLMTTQRVGGFRAALAAFLPPLAAIAVMFGLIALPIYAVSSSVNTSWSTTTGAAGITAYGNAQSAAVAVLSYAQSHGGRAPGHAAQLIHSNDLAPARLSQTGNLSAVRIGTISLDRFILLPDQQEQAAADAAAARLPAGTIAHRAGDLVFTYHGIDLANPDPDLWLVVASPDPDFGRTPHTPRSTIIGIAGGANLLVIPPGQFAAALQAQNALRATHGLPPLPDPATVTTDTPATGGP